MSSVAIGDSSPSLLLGATLRLGSHRSPMTGNIYDNLIGDRVSFLVAKRACRWLS
jgi:hypothetical protein